jgi:hypothetical protein
VSSDKQKFIAGHKDILQINIAVKATFSSIIEGILQLK